MNPYVRELRLRSADVDVFRRLRLSVLFTLLQEASIAHTTELGMGREMTLDRGLLWIVTMQNVWIRRLPVYDESVTLTSRPGKTMHVYFPRYYSLTDDKGDVLLTASALWALIRADERRIIFPEEYGIAIDGSDTKDDPRIPRMPKMPEMQKEHTYRVPFSATDLNGHMNNARCLDLAQDLMSSSLRERDVTKIAVDYRAEAREGDVLRLAFREDPDAFFLAAASDRTLFRLALSY